MDVKKLGLSLLLVDFLGLSAFAVYRHGFVGVFEAVLANAATLTAFTDLVIALSLIAVWMWHDARERGVSPIPFLVVTALLGSAGPLLYLIRRERAPRVA